jgi:hypothetical protein
MATDEKTHRHPLEDFVPEETIEHVKAARAQMRQSVEAFFPPGFIEHRRAARKEMLLAARSLIDAAIRRMEPPQAGTKV